MGSAEEEGKEPKLSSERTNERNERTNQPVSLHTYINRGCMQFEGLGKDGMS